MTDNPTPLLAPDLSSLRRDCILHGFFTRKGGVSTGVYQSLNLGLGSGDIRAHVQENRRRVTAVLGVGDGFLVTARQVHSADVVTIDAPFAAARPQADAIVTATAGLALGVLTADCGPVLFADARAGVIAAAHAGWRGALAGIVENTVSAMVALGARREDITAVLGPCIGPAHYEVGEELHAAFSAADSSNGRFFIPSHKKAGRFYFNLRNFITDRLEKTGVQASAIRICTYAEDRCFFSFRRTTHNREPDYGRQISAIVLGRRS